MTLIMGGLLSANAQQKMTPEKLWELGRVSAIGLTKDGKSVVYKVTHPNVSENKFDAKTYVISIDGGAPKEIENAETLIENKNISPDGKWLLYHEAVKVENVLAQDFYKDVDKAQAQIYEGLNYRHWDTWNEGKFNHVFVRENKEGSPGTDIMKGEPYDSPQRPFGGEEDYVWSPSGKIVYVSKKKSGTEYAKSTNTDLYEYDPATGQTRNLTESNTGYDTHPDFSKSGAMAWLQMKRDGYEADKNDIIVRENGVDINLTANWDGHVEEFKWAPDGKTIYFAAAVKGTRQLFSVNYPGRTRIAVRVQQLTDGDFDVTGITGFSGDKIIVSRTSFNRAPELFSYDVKRKNWKQITTVNDQVYAKLQPSQTEKRWVETTDGKQMLVWVIYPPGFDKNKKYPTLLYCQGGPQSALTQFYSFRWNLQLMAAQGYIVVAPNRRGMQGHGVAWNEQISKDWGGQVMDDYLSAIDAVAKEPFVDKNRLGAIGASYGGYSVFYLAGKHNGRFKSFIAHNGVFNLESMYGTTEEVFFTNWDSGGPYWEKDNAAAQKTYRDFNPIHFVDRWDTPILIYQGGKDYRVPIGQGQEAFQAAQLRGIKSRFVYFPEENHWILQPQNALVWQREFFKWLEQTL